MHDDARKVFRDVANKNLDWPEAIWESWVAFEHLHGSIEQLEECLDRVERARNQVNARRAKEAEKAAYQAMQVSAEQQAATGSVAEAASADASKAEVAATSDGVPMDVDPDTLIEQAISSAKRKAEDEGPGDGSKKPRVGEYFVGVLMVVA